MTGPDTPPPFPGHHSGRSRRPGCGARSHRTGGAGDGYRSGGSGRDDWAEAYLGKPCDMSWSTYLGLGDLGGRPRRDRTRGSGGTGNPAYGTADGMEEATMPRMDPIYSSPNPNRLYRNTREGKLGGVCAGIADFFNVDAALVRIGWVVGLFLFTPVFLFGYLLLWVILKTRPAQLFETPEDEKFWRSVTTRPDQTLSALRAKFRQMDQKISAMEGYVASNEYSLNRQFRDLEGR